MLEIADRLYPDAYWNLRYVSLVELPKTHQVLMKDCYVLLANLEVMYYLDAQDLFIDDGHRSLYSTTHIEPYTYTMKIMEKLKRANDFKMVTLEKFYDTYKLRKPAISTLGKGLPSDILVTTRVHPKYLTHPVSLRKLPKVIAEVSIKCNT